ncbi:hypothetical protein T4D_14636 [Trichinella pseudospiralis]|uniref:Uncharacterized protein n=1 Tax=Trichinella pseudospiralis TaxID=6337 RepID=A0A0V1FY45_TRIPS|nr:hypothetical protein T4D_14636 [Trichinella pseudospiralis]
MDYVFTQILPYSHAVLNCASMKAHDWTFSDMSGFAGPDCCKPTSRLQCLLSLQSNRLCNLPVWLSRYHDGYGMESHKQKQPCTEPADPQQTYTLDSKNRIYLFGDFQTGER